MPAEQPNPGVNFTPLDLLLESLPAKHLLRFLKQHPALMRTVFLGFTPREKTLALPLVFQRIQQELGKQPQLVEDLATCWRQVYASLLQQVTAPEFSPTPQHLAALQKKHGISAMRYGLMQADRDEVRALADTLTEAPAMQTPAVESHTSAAVKNETSALKATIRHLERTITELTGQLEAARRRTEEACAQRDNALRHAQEADEEIRLLRHELEQQANLPPASPAPSSEFISAVEEAIAALQRGFSTLTPTTEQALRHKSTSTGTKKTRQPVPHTPTGSPVTTITLPASRGQRTYTLRDVLIAVQRNDCTLLEELRDGIARLAKHPARERAVMDQLTQAGIPDVLFQAPLRPAVIDGSNVANLHSDSRRARLAYIQQARERAWREGYFPVTIIVDASLRHQIDRSDLLMEMVERQEIVMAPAGTSADELLIDEARRQQAIIITNDRMTDWPAARELEKRHVELIGGQVTLGMSHRSSNLWFH